MERCDLSVVVPAFNEEACTEEAITELIQVFEKRCFKYELVVVHNGSSDNTLKEVFIECCCLLYHLIVGLLFRIHITDVNGYPVMTKKDPFEKMGFTRKDWMLNIEISLEPRKRGLITAELNVPHRERLGGKSHAKWFFPLLFLVQLVHFRWCVYRLGLLRHLQTE